MDLSQYSTEDLVLTALRAEVGAKAVYTALAEGVKNAYLKGRLEFLADEEEKHREYLAGLYRKDFGKEPVLPEESPVPLPDVDLPTEHVPMSSLFEQAMAAEKAASEFYLGVSERFPEGSEARDMLVYFSRMEMGHYSILETERDAAAEFEEFDSMWPLMHVGR